MKYLTNILKYILIPDWKLVYAIRGSWDITTLQPYGVKSNSTSYCVFEIYHSEIRNKYKLKAKGHCAEEHPRYIDACQELINLNQTTK